MYVIAVRRRRHRDPATVGRLAGRRLGRAVGRVETRVEPVHASSRAAVCDDRPAVVLVVRRRLARRRQAGVVRVAVVGVVLERPVTVMGWRGRRDDRLALVVVGVVAAHVVTTTLLVVPLGVVRPQVVARPGGHPGRRPVAQLGASVGQAIVYVGGVASVGRRRGHAFRLRLAVVGRVRVIVQVTYRIIPVGIHSSGVFKHWSRHWLLLEEMRRKLPVDALINLK